MKADMKARISLLHKTSAEWDEFSEKRLAAGNPFIPAAGELIVYDADDTCAYARIKVGDGISQLAALSFFATAAAEDTLKKHGYSEIFDAGHITDYLKI